MPISLPQSKLDIDTGNAVELPFPAPSFWIINGNAQMRAVGGVHYFGGWGISVAKLEEALDHWQDLPYPVPGLETTEYVPDGNGSPLDIYAARSLIVAPIGVRQFSVMNVNGQARRVAPFTPGARPGIQVLVLLGYLDENRQAQAWAPVILKANGYQVNHLQKAMSDWKKAVSPAIKKFADGASPWYFWMNLGTHGADRKQEMVGSTNKQAITPVSVSIPQEFTAEGLENRYVGLENAEWMNEIHEQADEWLHAYDKPAASVPAYNAPPPPEEPSFDDEQIPF